MLTVHKLEFPENTVGGAQVTDCGQDCCALTVNTNITDAPDNVACKVTWRSVDVPPAAAEKPPLDWPAGIKTELGTTVTTLLLLNTVTVTPPLGATPVRLTVHGVDVPDRMDDCTHETPATVTELPPPDDWLIAMLLPVPVTAIELPPDVVPAMSVIEICEEVLSVVAAI
jgi:hypothetical protein